MTGPPAGRRPETDLPLLPNGAARLDFPDATPRPGRRAACRDRSASRDRARTTTRSSSGNHVLAGAFYATRLYRDLRERRGLVYHVGSALRMTKTRGMIELEYACDPQNVARARAIIERDLREMRTTPVRAGGAAAGPPAPPQQHSARRVERGRDRARSPHPFGRGPAARRARARRHTLPATRRRRGGGGVRAVAATGRSRGGRAGALRAAPSGARSSDDLAHAHFTGGGRRGLVATASRC